MIFSAHPPFGETVTVQSRDLEKIMAHKYELVATGNGFWISDKEGNNRTQVIDENGYWVGPDITSTSPSTSPSTSVSSSPSTSPSTSVSSSPSTSASSSLSSSPSAS